MEDWFSWLLGLEKMEFKEFKDEGTLSWINMPELWILFLVLIPASIGFAYIIYRMERAETSSRVKFFLAMVRASIIILIILLLCGPILSVDTIEKEKSYVLVLIDDSLSMDQKERLTDPEQILKIAVATGISEDDQLSPEEEAEVRKLSRMEIVKRVLANEKINLKGELEKRLKVRFFTFSSGLKTIAEVEDVKDMARLLVPRGNVTAIGDSLRQAFTAVGRGYVVAVIIISDGKNNYGTDPVDIAKELYKPRAIPIYTVVPGIPQVPKDIQVRDMEASDTILVTNQEAIKFRISSFGYEGLPAEIRLTEYKLEDPKAQLSTDPQDIIDRISKGNTVGSRSIELKGGDQRTGQIGEMGIEPIIYEPKEEGEYELILWIEPKEGELTEANNYCTHRISVRDEKIRVLFVDGPSRWEYRYLKNAFIRDEKTIIAHCRAAWSDRDFRWEITKGEEEITEFPGKLEDMIKYDVIVLGEIDPQDLYNTSEGLEKTWENIRRFVYEIGGGVVFIGGVRHNPRSFKGTPIGKLVPIIVDEEWMDRHLMDVLDQEYFYRLTSYGEDHPITRFPGMSLEQLKEFWESGEETALPGIRFFIKAKQLVAGATPLVDVPLDVEGRERTPLFVTWNYGAGRVFFSATDETWLWRKFVDDKYYYSFWWKVLDWARKGGKLKGTKRFRITLDKEVYKLGESVEFIVHAFDEKYEDLKDEQITIHVIPEEGDEIELILRASKELGDGYYMGSQQFRPGKYEVIAGDITDEMNQDRAEFEVVTLNLERQDPILDVAKLKAIGSASVGYDPDRKTCYMIHEIGDLPKDIKPGELTRVKTKEEDLWDSPLIYILFALLITVEWVARKMVRML
jgi:uncharacterized membrane protein